MRQFDPINNEVQVGYDAAFEHRWRVAEIIGRVIMLLVVAAALLGLLGRGPFSHHTIGSAGSGLLVDYEPVMRYDDITQITLHAMPLSCDHGMRIWVNSKIIEPMGLQNSIPRPLSSTPLPDGLILHYDLKPGACQNTLVRLFVKPSTVGPVPLKVRLDLNQPLAWHVFVMP